MIHIQLLLHVKTSQECICLLLEKYLQEVYTYRPTQQTYIVTCSHYIYTLRAQHNEQQ